MFNECMVPVEGRGEMGLCCEELPVGQAVAPISGTVHTVKPEETANPNKMFEFAEKHPASVTLTIFGQAALSEIPLQSHTQLPQLTEKMKILLEGVCGRVVLGCLGFGEFLVVVRWGF